MCCSYSENKGSLSLFTRALILQTAEQFDPDPAMCSSNASNIITVNPVLKGALECVFLGWYQTKPTNTSGEEN